jgi:hypothetical protein
MFRLSPRSFRLTRSPRNRCRLKVRRDLFSELSGHHNAYASVAITRSNHAVGDQPDLGLA